MEVTEPSAKSNMEVTEPSAESNMEVTEPEEIRLVLIGKTGNGKSTVGNILLGKRHFKTGCSMASTTVKPAFGLEQINGKMIKVVDTPDITNLELPNEDAAQREVATWMAISSPGPHAVLLTVRCDVRYTREEYAIYLQLKRLWGGDNLVRRLVVAFTFGDRQDKDLRTELKTVCAELQNVLKDASNRHVLFNDKDGEEKKKLQAKALLNLVQTLEAKERVKDKERLLSGNQICHVGPTGKSPLTKKSSLKWSLGVSSTSAPNVVRLLLVGRAGTGKSSTGNTILGHETFPVHRPQPSADHASMMGKTKIGERILQVIDTPGLQAAESKDAFYLREKETALNFALPGPHALLYVVRYQQVTKADLDGFLSLQKQLGQGLSHHTIVALVGAPDKRPTVQAAAAKTVRRVASLGSEPPLRHHDKAQVAVTLSDPSRHPGKAQVAVALRDPSACPSSRSKDVQAMQQQQQPSRCRASSDSEPTPAHVPRQNIEEGLYFERLLQVAGNKLWLVNNPTKNIDGISGSRNSVRAEEDGPRRRQVQVLLDVVQGILDNSGGECFRGEATADVVGQRRSGEVGGREQKATHKRSTCWPL